MFKPALKSILIVFGIAILVQTLPAYYRSNEFDYYLKRQTRSATESDLKKTLLTKAREYSLPVKEENITVSTTGRTYRVAVNYSIPIDLLVFSHEMKFQYSGGGWLAK